MTTLTLKHALAFFCAFAVIAIVVACTAFRSSNQDFQEKENAEKDVLAAIHEAQEGAPISFEDRRRPVDYFAPQCTASGVLTSSVKKLQIRSLSIMGDSGSMSLNVVFESYPPIEKAQTYTFIVNLELEKVSEKWVINQVNPVP